MISSTDRHCGWTGRREGGGFHVEIFTLGSLPVNMLLMLVLGLLENALDGMVAGLFVCFRFGEIQGSRGHREMTFPVRRRQ